VPETFCIVTKRPNRCPRWLWRISSDNPILTVDGVEHALTWDSETTIPITTHRAKARLIHLLRGRTTWLQKADAMVQPNDIVIYQALWLPRFTRQMTVERHEEPDPV
jgi:hypothetical protein